MIMLPTYKTLFRERIHLLMEGLCHFELKRGYHVMISLELSKILEELKIEEFRWVKLEILKEVDRFYDGSSNDSEEED